MRRAAIGILGVVIACSSSSTTTTSNPADGGGAEVDGGASDAAACVTIDPATYDKTCTADTDCSLFSTGTICTGGCDCGGTALNNKELDRYEKALSSVKPLACPCAYPGTPRCVQGACVTCAFGPNAAPGCPDGG